MGCGIKLKTRCCFECDEIGCKNRCLGKIDKLESKNNCDLYINIKFDICKYK